MSEETGTRTDEAATEATADGRRPRASVSRRRFLVLTGVAAGLTVGAGACSGDDGAEQRGGTLPRPTTPPAQTVDNDVAVAELAAGLEKLAVDTYEATLTAATGGKLGAVPPAMAAFVTTAKEQHEVHLTSWNTLLRGVGRPQVSAPHAALKPFVDKVFADVDDASSAARLALTLENIASHTYNKAIPRLRDPAAIRLAGQIQVVDQQHVATLRYLLGAYPVGTADLNQATVAFQPTDQAASA